MTTATTADPALRKAPSKVTPPATITTKATTTDPMTDSVPATAKATAKATVKATAKVTATAPATTPMKAPTAAPSPPLETYLAPKTTAPATPAKMKATTVTASESTRIPWLIVTKKKITNMAVIVIQPAIVVQPAIRNAI